MAKEKLKAKKAAQSSDGVKNLIDRTEMATLMGEELGDALLMLLQMQGSDFDALVTQTYALAKAWASVLVVSKNRGFDMTELFDSLLPSFQQEMEEMLESKN